MNKEYTVIHCSQGSKEWLDARAGIITASMFKVIMKRLKKDNSFSAEAKKYAFKLAIERISGARLDEDKFETYEMRRGRELEPEARLLHESKTNQLVIECGFAVSSCGFYGSSLDGEIGDNGTSEYKCFIGPDSLRPILIDSDLSDCEAQIQGGLWITGRQWCDFVLYCPALKNIDKDLTIFRVHRNEEYIADLQNNLEEFNAMVSEYVQMIKSSNAGKYEIGKPEEEKKDDISEMSEEELLNSIPNR